MNKKENTEKFKELFECIELALKRVYENDIHLISYPSLRGTKNAYHVGERSIVFRFAHYLQNLLDINHLYSEYDLDVEYNRNNEKPKYLEINVKRRVAPDVILHKRTSNDDNILVIEFKGHWNHNTDEIEQDKNKLMKFTNQQSEYKFSVGLFIFLGIDYNSTIVEVYENGLEIFNGYIGGVFNNGI